MSEESELSSGERWGDLITEGHVRAARLRWVQPWLVTTGIATILFGFYCAICVPVGTGYQSRAATDEVSRAQTPVNEALDHLPPIQLSPDEEKQLVSAAELPQVATLIQDELNKSGKLPAMPIIDVATTDFWKKPWPTTKLVTVHNKNIRLVGAMANDGTSDYPHAIRWVGVYAFRAGKWEMLSATDGDFRPMTKVTASLLDIPLTVKSVLPEVSHDQ